MGVLSDEKGEFFKNYPFHREGIKEEWKERDGEIDKG